MNYRKFYFLFFLFGTFTISSITFMFISYTYYKLYNVAKYDILIGSVNNSEVLYNIAKNDLIKGKIDRSIAAIDYALFINETQCLKNCDKYRNKYLNFRDKILSK